MKEIDFLPEWYSRGKRYQYRTQRQYVALAILFLMMVLWNAMALRLINQAQARLDLTLPQQAHAKGVAEDFRRLELNWRNQQQWLEHVDRLDTRFEIAPVLSELSYCVNAQTEITDVSISERPLQEDLMMTRPYDPIVYECVIEGVTPSDSGVGQLIENLEQSDFFTRVQLGWSKQKEGESVTRFQVQADLNNGLKRPFDER